MSEADDVNTMIGQMSDAAETRELGLHGILFKLAVECELFLSSRGHRHLPDDPEGVYKFLTDYCETPEANLEPKDGSATVSEVLLLLAGIHAVRERLIEDEVGVDQNDFGFEIIQLGMFAQKLKFAPERKLAYTAIRSKEGAAKGNRSSERLDPVKERNEGILQAARKFLAAGYERHNLAALFAQKYGNYPDYPSTARQYREILKGLDK